MHRTTERHLATRRHAARSSSIAACVCCLVGFVVAVRAGERDCPPDVDAVMSLRLVAPAEACLEPGEELRIVLQMSCLNQAVNGYQAFLAFDADRLQFVSGEYRLPDPFGLPFLWPITAIGDSINLAAGINAFAGQPPTSADAELAVLVFIALGPGDSTTVRFRDGAFPTRLTGTDLSIVPMKEDTPEIRLQTSCACGPPGDLDCDVDVDLADFAVLQDQFGLPAGAMYEQGDIDGNGAVDAADLELLLAALTGP